VDCVVNAPVNKAGIVALTIRRERIASAIATAGDILSISTVVPGMLVKARILAVLKDGYVCSLVLLMHHVA
jgi:hypothetical protein